ncbi:rhombosortase [Amphritea opalescens]|uniref:Rhombosortase n=1 Tax=Amphritea opalescens TaxID=2490544 RepID=A0A430KQL9_9GAMM|nr:rhombosortase [Amphritea opalescens]RTE65782.1 rhombosortase [Amphritea opalescens]
MNTSNNINVNTPPALAGGVRLPFITLVIILIALPLSLSPSLFELSYFDQQLIQQGQLWRLVSGHLSHTSSSHLLWDLLAFALAAGYLELHSPKYLLAALLAAVFLLDVHLMSPASGISRYAGLSGLLFAPLTLSLVIFARQQPSLNGWLPLLICLGKLIWEQFSQQALLSQSAWPAYPTAHLVGSLAGVVVILGWMIETDKFKARNTSSELTRTHH